jgi:nucleoside-diphosphate-sugar epimerase
MRILIIGGTRNLGPELVAALLAREHRVTVLNRGHTPDDLPAEVERLRADRTQPLLLGAALAGRSWDAVVDLTLYTGADARIVVDLLDGRTGHYLFVSTGQVYLVRDGAPRPTREEDYDGPLLPEPPPGTRDHANWRYGMDKRAAEDVLAEAHAAAGFPFTSLRLPMVNSARDHYDRLYGYLLRLHDRGPIVAPAEVDLPLRHVYGGDVVRIIADLVEGGEGKGRAYNLAQDETLTLEEFLRCVAGLCGMASPAVVRLPLAALDERGLFPACSPFSDPWMSALDNTRSKVELGARYTPVQEYLARLVSEYSAAPRRMPVGYLRRAEELALVEDQGWAVPRRPLEAKPSVSADLDS